MARPLRIEYEGAVYHVTARGNERKKIFFSKTDYGKFLTYLKEAKKKYNVDLHCSGVKLQQLKRLCPLSGADPFSFVIQGDD